MPRRSGPGLLQAHLTDAILAAFYEVHSELGAGFLESVYENAMVLVLRGRGLPVARQVPISVWFRGVRVGDFRADMVVGSLVLVELKACRCLEPAHEAQVLNHLRATDLEVALLLNFAPRAQFKRLVYENARKAGKPPAPRSPPEPPSAAEGRT